MIADKEEEKDKMGRAEQGKSLLRESLVLYNSGELSVKNNRSLVKKKTVRGF